MPPNLLRSMMVNSILNTSWALGVRKPRPFATVDKKGSQHTFSNFWPCSFHMTRAWLLGHVHLAIMLPRLGDVTKDLVKCCSTAVCLRIFFFVLFLYLFGTKITDLNIVLQKKLMHMC